MKNRMGQEISEHWNYSVYKKGGDQYLRIGQKVKFTYFSKYTLKNEIHEAKVIDRTYHVGHYLVEDSEGKRWTIYRDTHTQYGWGSSDSEYM